VTETVMDWLNGLAAGFYDNGSVVNRVSPRKICVHEDGRITETRTAVK
jgi:hypothetical protein